MDVYLVGGAVRDELLGRPVRERDWVVVGASAAAMRAAGYRQVGRDFPVFLHPETGEEYALARTERKTGPGHKGFDVDAAGVTLEEDLRRRDLTINAMAKSAAGELIDPWGGRADLKRRVLRHVSEAFTDDPLRAFRVARFAAELPAFDVAPETRSLIRRMAAGGALAELSAERVWAELARALDAPAATRFVAVLEDCAALSPWFVEFDTVDPVACAGLESGEQRFAAYVSNLPPEALDALGERLKVPRRHLRLARWLVVHGRLIADWPRQAPEAVFRALLGARAFKRDSDLHYLLPLVERLHCVDLAALNRAVGEAANVRAAEPAFRGLEGPELGEALARGRIAALAAAAAAVRAAPASE